MMGLAEIGGTGGAVVVEPPPVVPVAPVTWADRYRVAGRRLLDLAQTETDGLVKSALSAAAAKCVLTALEHEDLERRNALRSLGVTVVGGR